MQFRHSGFSAIELLVTMAIASIMAVLAVPGFQGLILSSRTTTIGNQLYSDMNLARSEAIKRNARVLMCIANSARTGCATSGSDWSVGWAICVDSSKAGACDASTAAAPNPLIQRATIPAGLTLVGKSGVTTNLIKFNSDGSAVAAELDLTGNNKRCLTIANTGTISVNTAC